MSALKLIHTLWLVECANKCIVQCLSVYLQAKEAAEQAARKGPMVYTLESNKRPTPPLSTGGTDRARGNASDSDQFYSDSEEEDLDECVLCVVTLSL